MVGPGRRQRLGGARACVNNAVQMQLRFIYMYASVCECVFTYVYVYVLPIDSVEIGLYLVSLNATFAEF